MMRETLKKLSASALIVAALVFPLAASAQTEGRNDRSRTVNGRERHQRQRITQGVRNGELTRRETTRLAKQQAAIRARERYARRSGGEYTARERARTQRALNRSSRNIYRQKHDRQDRN